MMTQQVVSYQILGSPSGDSALIIDSTGQVCASSDPDELLSFLRYKQSGVLRVFWDLDGSLAPLLRMLPLPVLESLSRFDENTMQGEHQLYYLPDRSFRVGRARLYGIRGFWPTDYPEPTSLSELQSRAEELLLTLAVCGMPDPIKLTSPIAVFEGTDLGRSVYASLPKGHDLPMESWEALEYAYKADRREWITAYQLGHWPEGAIWDYDCTACYPSVASGLVDIRDMDIWKSEELGSQERSAYYGVLRGRLWLDPDAEFAHCSPIMADLERMPGNPCGDFGEDYYLTLDELRFVEQYELGSFTLRSGWFLHPKQGIPLRYPFRKIMEELYKWRSLSPLASSIMKGVANQLIGKLIETKVTGDYGDLRNDLYHALILSQARVRVAEFLASNEVRPEELVVVQTDGCRLTRQIPVHSNGLGSWRCNGSAATIVASPYKVYSGDKKPGHLTYQDVTGLVGEHPLTRWYGGAVEHRMTLRQAIQSGDISKVGTVEYLPAHLDLVALGREQNRVFPKLPKTGAGLLNGVYPSEPIVL
jgi:hypothetical protein